MHTFQIIQVLSFHDLPYIRLHYSSQFLGRPAVDRLIHTAQPDADCAAGTRKRFGRLVGKGTLSFRLFSWITTPTLDLVCDSQ